MGTTPKGLERSYFDALTKAAKKRNLSPKTELSPKTFYLIVDKPDILSQLVGTHRIQRIPPGSTRRHTSTVTISLVENKSTIFELDEKDLEERFTKSSGPGGQHKNKTSSCVYLKHIPTGIEVKADSRSQYENRQAARKELSRRVEALTIEDEAVRVNNERKIDPERSSKSFTYNEQRDEVVAHDLNKKWRMSSFMKGKI